MTALTLFTSFVSDFEYNSKMTHTYSLNFEKSIVSASSVHGPRTRCKKLFLNAMSSSPRTLKTKQEKMFLLFQPRGGVFHGSLVRPPAWAPKICALCHACALSLTKLLRPAVFHQVRLVIVRTVHAILMTTDCTMLPVTWLVSFVLRWFRPCHS